MTVKSDSEHEAMRAQEHRKAHSDYDRGEVDVRTSSRTIIITIIVSRGGGNDISLLSASRYFRFIGCTWGNHCFDFQRSGGHRYSVSSSLSIGCVITVLCGELRQLV